MRSTLCLISCAQSHLHTTIDQRVPPPINLLIFPQWQIQELTCVVTSVQAVRDGSESVAVPITTSVYEPFTLLAGPVVEEGGERASAAAWRRWQ